MIPPVAPLCGPIAPRGSLLVVAMSVLLLLNGCPLGDHYVIEADGQAGAATAASGAPSAGLSGAAGLPGGGSNSGGTSGGTAGQPGIASCQPSQERCNGLDDDCDSQTDGRVCTTGCTGIALGGHGYMFCARTAVATFNAAKSACAAQGQHVVWLEDAAEARALQQAIDPAISGGEYYLGATDVEQEGTWHWVGGTTFWSGASTGKPVSRAYSNWARTDPDGSASKNCAVVAADATWRDRACSDVEAFICEDP